MLLAEWGILRYNTREVYGVHGNRQSTNPSEHQSNFTGGFAEVVEEGRIPVFHTPPVSNIHVRNGLDTGFVPPRGVFSHSKDNLNHRVDDFLGRVYTSDVRLYLPINSVFIYETITILNFHIITNTNLI